MPHTSPRESRNNPTFDFVARRFGAFGTHTSERRRRFVGGIVPSSVKYREAAASIEVVTPDQASGMLRRNTGNRPLNEARAMALAQAIMRGEWVFNAQSVAVGTDGRLLDGQHRLRAIEISGIGVPLLVCRGLPLLAMRTIDIGAKRTNGNMLRVLRGMKSANQVATAVGHLYRLLIGPSALTRYQIPTPTEVDSLIDEYPDVIAGVEVYRTAAFRRLTKRTGAFAALYALTMPTLPGETAEFASQLVKGVDVASPVAHLRNFALDIRLKESSKMGTYRRVPNKQFIGCMIKAWNTFAQGNEMKRLFMTKREKFPAIVGGPGWTAPNGD